jgi:glycosyltransferase involved in cell wall biosynthesis
MRDTLVHGETALLAAVSSEVWVNEAVVGQDQGYDSQRRIVFANPRAADFRASVFDLSEHLMTLMTDSALREKMGAAGRRRVCENYNYRKVAEQFVRLIGEHLGVS